MRPGMEMEMMLRPPSSNLTEYPPKYITLANGEKMVIRQIRRDEIPTLMEAIVPLIQVEKDFYDIVAARFYAELLSLHRHRVKDEFCLVGAINGVIASMCNSRMINPREGMSYHTMTINRGLRCGAQMFAAKMEHHIEYLGQEEVLITAESPIGFRRWMIEYNLEKRDGQHELGGATPYALTRELYFKNKDRLVAGERPVPGKLMEIAEREIKVASEDDIREKILGARRRQVR